MHPPTSRPAPGFTLIELAIVMAIAALLLRAAVPDMSRLVAARALAAQASEFLAALRFARAQAIARGQVVTVCAQDAGSAPRCRPPGAADWRDGWVVFADGGSPGRIDAGDAPLRVQAPLAHSGGVAGTRASVSFTAAGYAKDGSSHFLFAPAAAADAPASLQVCVSKQGRPRLASGGGCS